MIVARSGRREPLRCLRLVVVVVSLVMMLTACDGSGNTAEGNGEGAPSPSPTATSAPTTTATSASTPAAATPSVAAEPELPQGRVVVYTTQVDLKHSGNRAFPIREVVVYDLDERRALSSFTYGGVDDSPRGAVLADLYVVTATEQGITRYGLDGSDAFSLLRSPGVNDIAASPDGSTLAATVASNVRERNGEVVFIDVETGDVLQRARRADGGFEDSAGFLGELHWRLDGEGVVVKGGTQSGQPGGLATVTLGGTVRVHPVEAFAWVEPRGRSVAYGEPPLCGMTIAGHRVIIFGLRDDERLNLVDAPDRAVSPVAWSPDGSEFLYESRPWTEQGGCDLGAAPERFLLRPSGEPEPVDDVQVLYERWYGDYLVELDCDDGRQVVLPGRWLDWRGRCPAQVTPPVPHTLLIGGQPVGEVADPAILGSHPEQ